MDPAASYLEGLAFALASTTGHVLELGAGEYSTSLLHGYCEAAGRLLITVESDPEWFERVKVMETLQHLVVPGGFPEGTYGVAFVDNGAEDRGPSILRGLMYSQMVVVHDTEPEVAGFYPGMHEAMKGAKWRRDFKRVTPWTTVLSSSSKVAQETAGS